MIFRAPLMNKSIGNNPLIPNYEIVSYATYCIKRPIK